MLSVTQHCFPLLIVFIVHAKVSRWLKESNYCSEICKCLLEVGWRKWTSCLFIANRYACCKVHKGILMYVIFIYYHHLKEGLWNQYESITSSTKFSCRKCHLITLSAEGADSLLYRNVWSFPTIPFHLKNIRYFAQKKSSKLLKKKVFFFMLLWLWTALFLLRVENARHKLEVITKQAKV